MPESSFLTDTRTGYDTIAPAYSEQFAGELETTPQAALLLMRSS
ncbi:hypothetical protein [Nocardia sp. NPDC019395]